jgi:hypothetical protein
MSALKILMYAIAAISSATCAVLLLRAYAHRRIRLLMWSGICFIGLTINNVALFVDLVVFPQIDLRLARLVPALAGMMCLLYGFIFDADS